jgi:hypothetical protein
LNAVSQFQASKFDEAIDTFFKLDLNPAKVIALYPESVSGRLVVPQREWIQLYGGPAPIEESCDPSPTSQTASGTDHRSPSDESHDKGVKHDKSAAELLDAVTDTTPSLASTSSGTIKRLKGAGLGLLSGGHKEKDDDTASVHSVRRGPVPGEFTSLFLEAPATP